MIEEVEYIQIDNWCIRRKPKSHETINKWFNENTGNVYTSICDFYKGNKNVPAYWNYLHYKPKGKKLYMWIIPGYTEITYKEFRECILQKPFIKRKLNIRRVMREVISEKKNLVK